MMDFSTMEMFGFITLGFSFGAGFFLPLAVGRHIMASMDLN